MMKERLPTLKFLPNKESEMDAKMFTIEIAVLVYKYVRLTAIIISLLPSYGLVPH